MILIINAFLAELLFMLDVFLHRGKILPRHDSTWIAEINVNWTVKAAANVFSPFWFIEMQHIEKVSAEKYLLSKVFKNLY
jgi:hypothetical protein